MEKSLIGGVMNYSILQGLCCPRCGCSRLKGTIMFTCIDCNLTVSFYELEEVDPFEDRDQSEEEE
jgi:hypothetical protein